MPPTGLAQRGDAHCDGTFDCRDSLVILQYEAALISRVCPMPHDAYPDFDWASDLADVDESRVIDAWDARAVLMLHADCYSHFPPFVRRCQFQQRRSFTPDRFEQLVHPTVAVPLRPKGNPRFNKLLTPLP
jgi:hypothetical protein